MKQSKLLAYTFAFSSSLFMIGCGSSGNDSASSLNGDLEVAVTDAEEDFLTYRIELESIELKKANGALVEVLPLETEIDFVQYQELSELFAVLSVPAGEYESVVLGLDYTDADIVIQDEAGISYSATVQDTEGNAVTKIDVELNLNDGETIHITPFKTAQLTLDLDLAASNTIESFDPPLVTVEPFMIGSTSLDLDREHRIRGLLEDVNIEEQEVTINLIPMRLRRGGFGEYSFHVNDDTVYEIDGEEYGAAEGLALLAEQPEDTPVVGFGGPSQDDQVRYLASQVLVGSSVPWAEQDVLKGIVTARTDNTISIRGAVVETVDQAAHFLADLTLTVSDDTVVTGYRLGDATIANLSIGQRILALGEFDADANSFDGTAGHVRMKLNAIVGEVTQASPLELDLTHINKRPVELFDFAGTGVDAANDANPDQYEVETNTLDTTGIEADEWLQVRGYPTAFGSAPADFDALSIINPDFNSHPARMFALWPQLSTDGIEEVAGELVLNLDDARTKLHLKGVPGSSRLDIVPEKLISTSGEGRFALLVRGEGIHVYTDFASFISNASRYMQDGFGVHQLTAAGQYSDANGTIDANYATIRLAEIAGAVSDDDAQDEDIDDGADDDVAENNSSEDEPAVE